MFFVLYITKSSARTGIAAGRDEIFFCRMGGRCHRRLQVRQRRRSALQLSGESFNCAQGGGANVMFHSLYIMINDAIVEAKQSQKISQKFMPLGDFMGQALTGCSQNKSAILLVFEEPLGVQSLNHCRQARLG